MEINRYFTACGNHIVGFKVMYHSSSINSRAHTQSVHVSIPVISMSSIGNAISVILHFEHGNTIQIHNGIMLIQECIHQRHIPVHFGCMPLLTLC